MKKIIPSIVTSILFFTVTNHSINAAGYYTNDGLAEPDDYPTTKVAPIVAKGPTTTTVTPSKITLPNNIIALDSNSDENIIDPAFDKRKLVENIDVIPYKMNVLLQITWKNNVCLPSLASGAMVGYDSVLTAGHAVFNNSCKGFADSITVIAGASNAGGNDVSSKYGTSKSIKLYAPKEYVEKNDRSYDIGLIKIADNLGKATGTYGIANNIQSGEEISIAGFPGDKPKGNQYVATGKVTTLTDRLAFHTVDTAKGQSGAPMVRKDTNEIVAVHAHGFNGFGPAENNGQIINSENLQLISLWMNKPISQSYDKKVSISRENEKLWSNFEFTKYNSTTTGQLGNVYDAKYLYNHSNGYTYLSLYDKDGVWAGYTNKNHVQDIKRTLLDQKIVIKNTKYDFWTSLFFDTKKTQSENYLNKTLTAKYMYELADGRQYYTVYSGDTFLGYINAKATI